MKEKYNNNKILRTTILRSKPKLLEIDLTPSCDYSQDKNYVRIIYGLLLDKKYYPIDIGSAYQLKSPILSINSKDKFILFDYRFIKTMSKDEILQRKIKPNYKLRKGICTELQCQLSNQINRPGISFL